MVSPAAARIHPLVPGRRCNVFVGLAMCLVLAPALPGLDLQTGRQVRKVSTRETFTVGHHHRCYRGKATSRFLLPSRRGVEFVDLASGRNHLNHRARGACLHGIVPCNGMLYLTPHPCDCNIEVQLNGDCALATVDGHVVRLDKAK